MDVETLKLIADISPWLSFVILTLLTVIWFRIRSGTSYGLLNRLYAIVIGGKEFHDNSIMVFWNERKDVERFNALFNTRAKSLKEVHLFVKWIERHNLDLQKLTKLNDYFDMEKREVKEGQYRLAAAFFVAVTLVLSVISLCLTVLAVEDAALIKFNNETQWMWLNHNAAYSVPLNDWRLTADACSQEPLETEALAAQTKLKPANILKICESFTNAEDIQRVEEIIKSQRSFLWLALGFLILTLYSFNYVQRLSSAYHAKTYLKKKLGDKKYRGKL